MFLDWLKKPFPYLVIDKKDSCFFFRITYTDVWAVYYSQKIKYRPWTQTTQQRSVTATIAIKTHQI